MGWVVLGVCIGAVVVGLLVLGFCAYELSGKQRRLRADLARLTVLREPADRALRRVAELQARLEAAERELVPRPPTG